MMEPMARKAVVEKRMGRPSRNASAVMAQVAFRGVCRCSFIAPQTRYKGTPPSRENAHSILNRQRFEFGLNPDSDIDRAMPVLASLL